jgi:hypothetical protein
MVLADRFRLTTGQNLKTLLGLGSINKLNLLRNRKRGFFNEEIISSSVCSLFIHS